MTVKLHNTLTRKTETFTPQDSHNVKIYTCGPTVYSYLHVGNWAAYIYWDILIRMLKANGMTPNRVMNLTDVGHLVSDADEGEDKLEKGARRDHKTAWEVAQFYIDDFVVGLKKLNITMPDHLVRATDYITQQQNLIRRLKAKGFVYQISDGLYYDTAKFPTYADFAHLDLKDLKAGARVAFNPEKHNPSDFALWKFSPLDHKRDMEWDTPSDLLSAPITPATAKGFPGWHLECSTMAMEILGETLDIHTGGIDHIPVHHTNEIAQSEGATGKIFSHYWLHNNYMKSNGVKISKSLGNGYTLQDLAQHEFSPMDYRMFVLQSHYRSESNFDFASLQAAANRLANWRKIASLRHQVYSDGDTAPQISLLAEKGVLLERLNNDLDTPGAMSFIDEVFNKIDARHQTNIDQASFNDFITWVDDLLGLKLADSTPDISDDSKRLILQRREARQNNDWKTADQIRDQLREQGIGLDDRQSQTVWYYL